MVIGATGATGATGPQGPPGTGINLKGGKPTVAELPTVDNEQGDTWLVEENGHLYVWDASQWVDAGQVQGPQGIPGEITLAVGDARYVKQAAAVFTGTAETNSSLTFKSPANVVGAAAGFINTQYTFGVTPSDASGSTRAAHQFAYDATNNQWTVGSAGFAANSVTIAGAGSFAGKVTTAATNSGDSSTTVTTKGYVDARVVVVASKPASASGYSEGALIVVAP